MEKSPLSLLFLKLFSFNQVNTEWKNNETKGKYLSEKWMKKRESGYINEKKGAPHERFLPKLEE